MIKWLTILKFTHFLLLRTAILIFSELPCISLYVYYLKDGKYCISISLPTVIRPLVYHNPAVNFTNIVWAAFAPKSFHQKITNPNCKHIKAAQKTFVQKAARKMFMKLTPGPNVIKLFTAVIYRHSMAIPSYVL